MYKYQEISNWHPDPSEIYTSWDVYFEDENGFEHICECPSEDKALQITVALNEQAKKEQDK